MSFVNSVENYFIVFCCSLVFFVGIGMVVYGLISMFLIGFWQGIALLAGVSSLSYFIFWKGKGRSRE